MTASPQPPSPTPTDPRTVLAPLEAEDADAHGLLLEPALHEAGGALGEVQPVLDDGLLHQRGLLDEPPGLGQRVEALPVLVLLLFSFHSRGGGDKGSQPCGGGAFASPSSSRLSVTTAPPRMYLQQLDALGVAQAAGQGQGREARLVLDQGVGPVLEEELHGLRDVGGHHGLVGVVCLGCVCGGGVGSCRASVSGGRTKGRAAAVR